LNNPIAPHKCFFFTLNTKAYDAIATLKSASLLKRIPQNNSRLPFKQLTWPHRFFVNNNLNFSDRAQACSTQTMNIFVYMFCTTIVSWQIQHFRVKILCYFEDSVLKVEYSKESLVFLARFCSLKDYFLCVNFNIFEKNIISV
jgi:hypothetical protein